MNGNARVMSVSSEVAGKASQADILQVSDIHSNIQRIVHVVRSIRIIVNNTVNMLKNLPAPLSILAQVN